MSGGDANPVLSPVKLPWKSKVPIAGVDKVRDGERRDALSQHEGCMLEFSAVPLLSESKTVKGGRHHVLLKHILDTAGNELADHTWVFLGEADYARLTTAQRTEFVGRVHSYDSQFVWSVEKDACIEQRYGFKYARVLAAVTATKTNKSEKHAAHQLNAANQKRKNEKMRALIIKLKEFFGHEQWLQIYEDLGITREDKLPCFVTSPEREGWVENSVWVCPQPPLKRWRSGELEPTDEEWLERGKLIKAERQAATEA